MVGVGTMQSMWVLHVRLTKLRARGRATRRYHVVGSVSGADAVRSLRLRVTIADLSGALAIVSYRRHGVSGTGLITQKTDGHTKQNTYRTLHYMQNCRFGRLGAWALGRLGAWALQGKVKHFSGRKLVPGG